MEVIQRVFNKDVPVIVDLEPVEDPADHASDGGKDPEVGDDAAADQDAVCNADLVGWPALFSIDISLVKLQPDGIGESGYDEKLPDDPEQGDDAQPHLLGRHLAVFRTDLLQDRLEGEQVIDHGQRHEDDECQDDEEGSGAGDGEEGGCDWE